MQLALNFDRLDMRLRQWHQPLLRCFCPKHSICDHGYGVLMKLCKFQPEINCYGDVQYCETKARNSSFILVLHL